MRGRENICVAGTFNDGFCRLLKSCARGLTPAFGLIFASAPLVALAVPPDVEGRWRISTVPPTSGLVVVGSSQALGLNVFASAVGVEFT